MARKCEECTEWEYFEGYGYGCFYGQTMTPIDADKCDGYALDNHDVLKSYKISEDGNEQKKMG